MLVWWYEVVLLYKERELLLSVLLQYFNKEGLDAFRFFLESILVAGKPISFTEKQDAAADEGSLQEREFDALHKFHRHVRPVLFFVCLCCVCVCPLVVCLCCVCMLFFVCLCCLFCFKTP